jgi:hypothetical protein
MTTPPATSLEGNGSAERIPSTAGQVTTLIIDTRLRGLEAPIEVVRLEEPATVVRARVYSHVDPARDVWEVLELGAVTLVGGNVLASGPEGPVRIILSAVG